MIYWTGNTIPMFDKDPYLSQPPVPEKPVGQSSTPTPEPSAQPTVPQVPTPQPPVAPGAVVKASFGALLGRSFDIYKKQWWKLLLLGIFPALIMAGIILLGAAGLAIYAFAGFSSGNVVVVGIIAFILFLAVVFVNMLFFAASMHVIADSGQGISFGEAFKRGKGHVLPLFWISVLANLVILGGYVMLIVPGIIWAITAVIVYWVVVVDNVRGRDALVRARQLMKGDGVRTFFLLFGIGLIMWLASMALVLLSGGLTQLSEGLGNFMTFVQMLLQFGALAPIGMAFNFAIYEDLKRRKEGKLPELPKQKMLFTIAAIIAPFLVILPMMILGITAQRAAQEKADEARALMEAAKEEAMGGVDGTQIDFGDTFPEDAFAEDEDDADASGFDSDIDQDGLSQLIEELRGTDPLNPDSDFDGLADGDETAYFKTDPLKTDSDGDGFLDADELRSGYHPAFADAVLNVQVWDKWKKDSELSGQDGFHEPTITTLKDTPLFQ